MSEISDVKKMRICTKCFAGAQPSEKTCFSCGAPTVVVDQENNAACIIASPDLCTEHPPLEVLGETYSSSEVTADCLYKSKRKYHKEPLRSYAETCRNEMSVMG